MKIAILLLFLVSCSSYVNKLHSQLDRDTHQNRENSYTHRKFDMYRGRNPKWQGPKNQLDYRKKSTKNTDQLLPQTRRDYRPSNKRYKAEDLYDNDSNGSLWSGRGQNNFLFAKNNIKKNGDIVVIKVQEKLKKEMSLELARAFPQRDKKKDKKTDKNNPNTTEQEPNVPPEKTSSKTYDSISSVVIEEINKDYLLLRGKKELLYHSRKRVVEVQSLVARKDILDDDSILSDNILESQVIIIR